MRVLFVTFFIGVFMMVSAQGLSNMQKELAILGSLGASGNLQKLEIAIDEALEKKSITINEMREVFIQLYAYSGFPRSLNALNTLQKVTQKRAGEGKKDDEGKVSSQIEKNIDKNAYGARVRADLMAQKEIPSPQGYQLFTPTIDDFLKEHLFADIFARDLLTYKDREIVTIAILGTLEDVVPQLKAHYRIGFNTGLTKEDMLSIVSIISQKTSEKSGKVAKEALEEFLQN